MNDGPITLVEDEATARLALSPLRRQLLTHLREPLSAAGLSAALGVARQTIGYHLKLLERAGLIVEAGARQRRGFTERLFVANAEALIVDPMILGNRDAVDTQDRHSAEHLVRTSARIVREVTRMRGEAEREGSRLLTLTIEADIGFASPAELDAFSARLTGAVAELARAYPAAADRKPYRLTVVNHPAVDARLTRVTLN